MIYKNCRKIISDSAKQCYSCGWATPGATYESVKETNDILKKILILLDLICLFGGCFVVIRYSLASGEELVSQKEISPMIFSEPCDVMIGDVYSKPQNEKRTMPNKAVSIETAFVNERTME